MSTPRSGRSPSAALSQSAILAAQALLSAACRIDQLDAESTFADAHEALAVTKEPTAPAPVVRAALELSPFAIEHFVELEVDVTVTSGQGLAGQGLLVRWLDGVEGGAVRADFEGPLSNALATRLVLGAPPCASGHCRADLELAARGDWASDVAFPMEYDISLVLELQRRERLPLDSDLELTLELVP